MLSVLKKHTLLYVEDNKDIQKDISEYLESFFAIVYVASDGKEALNLYKTYNPDVLLLDIDLPFIDGLTLAQKIRKNNSSIKIIMLTGYCDSSQLLIATELHLTKYLIKPVAPKCFTETLEKLSKELLETSSLFISLAKESIWDKEQEKLLVKEKNVPLSLKEHHLLKLFVEHKGKNVSYTDIMLSLWVDSFEREISIDSVKNQVSHLRKKLPKGCIDSVYGQGYILR